MIEILAAKDAVYHVDTQQKTWTGGPPTCTSEQPDHWHHTSMADQI